MAKIVFVESLGQTHSIRFSNTWGTWSLDYEERGVVALALPGGAVRAQAPQLIPPRWVKRAISLVESYTRGEKVSFSQIPLVLAKKGAFQQKVYQQLSKLSYGGVTTYQNLAKASGHEGAARAVGMAMKNNPLPLILPCHRVIASNGELRGYSAPGGINFKQRLLGLESQT